jgi:hypothetical protein
MDRKKPVGVPTGLNITAILTMLSSVTFGFLYFTAGLQNSVSLAFAGAGLAVSSAMGNLFAVFAPMFTLFGLIASIVLLVGNRSKLIWYTMIVYLVMLLGYFVFCERNVLTTYFSVFPQLLSGHLVDWSQFGGQYLFIETGLAYLTPFIYSLGCMGYLFSEKPKKYFCIE